MNVERVAGDGLHLSVTHRAPADGQRSHQGLLLLHGWPGTSADWRTVAHRLARDGRWDSVHLVLPDLRGFGLSDRPAADPTSPAPYAAFGPAAHCADLDVLIERLGFEQVIVAGYDLGANLAQALARRAPTRVAGLVLFDPVHPAARAQAGRLNPSELWYQHFHSLSWSHELVSSSRDSVELYLRHFYTHWWGEGTVPAAHFEEVVDSYSQEGAFESSIGWYRARAAGRAREVAAAGAAERSPVPVEVVWGRLDPITPLFFSDSLADSFTAANLVVAPTAGHFGPLECPDELVDALERLVARLGWQR